MLSGIEQMVSGMPLFWAGVIASLMAGLAAGVGALPVLFVDWASRRLQDVLLGSPIASFRTSISSRVPKAWTSA